MAIRKYTPEQLLHLRNSPLVQKPENLPAIEQWIDEVQQQQPQKENNGNRQRQQRPPLSTITGGESSPMGSFSTGQRPGLMHMRSKNADDMTLGPPKTSFSSSRNTSRLSNFHDQTTGAADATQADEGENVRNRNFTDRQVNRRSEKDTSESKINWGSLRDRRNAGEGDDHKGDGRERNDRFGRHDRDHDAERRNGFGEKGDNRWGRSNGEKQGGWREREHQRREREVQVEKEPEWMEDPVEKKEKDLGISAARTQEEFEKWRRAMKEESEPQHAEELATLPVSSPSAGLKVIQTLPKPEGFEPGLFGGWNKPAAAPSGEPPLTAPKTPVKPKTSRFASMFKPADEIPVEAVKSQAASNTVKTSAEEREGFDRLLAMLGNNKITTPAVQSEAVTTSPPATTKPIGLNGEGQKPRSRFFGSKEPETIMPASQIAMPLNGVDSVLETASRGPSEGALSATGNQTADRPGPEQQRGLAFDPHSALGPYNVFREQQPRPQSGRVKELSSPDPTARRSATPEDNIANLLAQQRQKPLATSNESQALLSLLTKTQSTGNPQASHVAPLGNGTHLDASQLPKWFEHQSAASTEPHAPKPRLPAPTGLFEEQLMRNYQSEQPLRHEHTVHIQGAPMAELPSRRTSQRAPPGFYDEAMFLQQQQQQQQQQRSQPQIHRGFQDIGQQLPQQGPPGRRMSGHPQLPQMQHIPYPNNIPPQAFQDMSSGVGLPPPGFHPQMPRHPPGLNNTPNIFQQPQQMPRDPPPPGFGTLQSPQGNAPPGFYPAQGLPPGFIQQPQHGTRSPTGGNGRGFDGFSPMR